MTAEGSDAESEAGDGEALPPSGSAQTGRPEDLDVPESVDWRGWLLVGIVVFSFVVVPVFVYYIPEMHAFIGALGFSQRQAYILFPMLPAIVLGATAVWAALRTARE